MEEVSTKRLKECVKYIAGEQYFYWLERPQSHFPKDKKISQEVLWKQWNSRFAGKRAGSARGKNGIVYIKLDGVVYTEHELLRIYVKDDKRLSFKKKQLVVDRGGAKESGVIGVSWSPGCKKWRSHISTRNMTYHENFDDAVTARYLEELKKPCRVYTKEGKISAMEHLLGKGLLPSEDVVENAKEEVITECPMIFEQEKTSNFTLVLVFMWIVSLILFGVFK